ncbi:MAG: YkvA family protein [Gaiellaceae bacterium]
MPDCAVLVKRLLRDPRVPRRAKLALGALIPYLAVPIDLVPDFIPVLGQLDDALLIAAALAYVARVAGREIVRELWPGDERGLRVVLALAR